MSSSSDAAEQLVRISLEGTEVMLKIAGSGAKNLAVIIYALMKDNKKVAGKTKLSNMLKSGKPIKVFSIKEVDYNKFIKEAKRYGILYCDLKSKIHDGMIDILVHQEDGAKITRIMDRMNLSTYNEGTINREPLNKEKDNKSNPESATTEKDPQSEPSSKMQKNSEQGAETKNKDSVKEKLIKAKEEAKRQNSQNKSESKIQAKKQKAKVKAK